MTSFVSVSTSAARYQDISLNPQKLAGQCAKLKCCLNYEVDCYVEAQKRLPSKEIELETKDGTFYFFKADILSNQVSYSTDKNIPANLVTISGKRAFEVIGLNKRGIKPDSLLEEEHKQEPKKPVDLVEQESLTRFDRDRRRKEGKEGGEGGNRNKKKKRPQQEGEGRVNRPQQENGNRSQQENGNRPQREGGNRPERPQRENGNRPNRPQPNSEGQQSSQPGNGNEQQRPRNDRPRNNNRRGDRQKNEERSQNSERPQNNEKPVKERNETPAQE